MSTLSPLGSVNFTGSCICFFRSPLAQGAVIWLTVPCLARWGSLWSGLSWKMDMEIYEVNHLEIGHFPWWCWTTSEGSRFGQTWDIVILRCMNMFQLLFGRILLAACEPSRNLLPSVRPEQSFSNARNWWTFAFRGGGRKGSRRRPRLSRAVAEIGGAWWSY